jgi:hypothetical protein
MLDSFFPYCHPMSSKDMLLSTNLKFLLFTSIKHTNIYLAFWAPFAFWEADFHKSKGKETLSRPYDDLEPADDKM